MSPCPSLEKFIFAHSFLAKSRHPLPPAEKHTPEKPWSSAASRPSFPWHLCQGSLKDLLTPPLWPCSLVPDPNGPDASGCHRPRWMLDITSIEGPIFTRSQAMAWTRLINVGHASFQAVTPGCCKSYAVCLPFLSFDMSRTWERSKLLTEAAIMCHTCLTQDGDCREVALPAKESSFPMRWALGAEQKTCWADSSHASHPFLFFFALCFDSLREGRTFWPHPGK